MFGRISGILQCHKKSGYRNALQPFVKLYYRSRAGVILDIFTGVGIRYCHSETKSARRSDFIFYRHRDALISFAKLNQSRLPTNDSGQFMVVRRTNSITSTRLLQLGCITSPPQARIFKGSRPFCTIINSVWDSFEALFAPVCIGFQRFWKSKISKIPACGGVLCPKLWSKMPLCPKLSERPPHPRRGYGLTVKADLCAR